MEKVIFTTNSPQELALRFIEGKPSESQFSAGMQHMFSTTDNRVFYVSETAGQAITAQLKTLEVEPGECITITKAEIDSGRGKRAIRWVVAPVSDAVEPVTAPLPPPAKRPVAKAAPEPSCGDRSDGTYAVPVLKPVPVAAPAEVPQTPEWARVLLTNTNVLIDIYAQAVKHSTQYNGAVKPETVHSILLSVFINQSKNSTLAVGK